MDWVVMDWVVVEVMEEEEEVVLNLLVEVNYFDLQLKPFI
jgi:hypothetical protein